MAASQNHHLDQILGNLEASAKVREQITKFDKGASLLSIETIIMHEITLLSHQLMLWNMKHSLMSPEPFAIKRIIEISNTLSKETDEDGGIEPYKVEGLDNLLTDEFKKLKNEDVAFDLQFYAELRASMNDRVMPKSAEQLGKSLASGLRIQERTSWIYANTVVEVLAV